MQRALAMTFRGSFYLYAYIQPRLTSHSPTNHAAAADITALPLSVFVFFVGTFLPADPSVTLTSPFPIALLEFSGCSSSPFSERFYRRMDVIEEISPGDHCALFFQTRAEQFSWVCPFIASGLRRNERCLYITYDNSVPMVLSKLSNAGIDVAVAQARSALRILTKEQSYQKHGMFEPARM